MGKRINYLVIGVVFVVVMVTGIIYVHSKNSINGNWILVSADSSKKYDVDSTAKLTTMKITNNKNYQLKNFLGADPEKGSITVDSKNNKLSIDDISANYSISDSKDKLTIQMNNTNTNELDGYENLVFIKKSSSEYSTVKNEISKNAKLQKLEADQAKKAEKLFNSSKVQGTWNLKSISNKDAGYIDSMKISGHKVNLIAHVRSNPTTGELYPKPTKFEFSRKIRNVSYVSKSKIEFMIGKKTMLMIYNGHNLNDYSHNFSMQR